jgi:predicted Zn-dependent protease with MMP-like domain
MDLSPDEFDQLVGEAVESLPEEFQRRLDNVTVMVQDYPTPAHLQRGGVSRGMTLLGLYEGVPLTQRTSGYNMVLPDRITIFRMPILAMCRTREDVRQTVAHTVMHEIAHHFGMSDEYLRHIGKY